MKAESKYVKFEPVGINEIAYMYIPIDIYSNTFRRKYSTYTDTLLNVVELRLDRTNNQLYEKRWCELKVNSKQIQRGIFSIGGGKCIIIRTPNTKDRKKIVYIVEEVDNKFNRTELTGYELTNQHLVIFFKSFFSIFCLNIYLK